MTENEITKIIVDVAFQVHKRLGPGLLETVYEVILAHELKKRGLSVKRQVPVAIVYDDIKFDEGFRADQFWVGTNTRWHIKSRKRSERLTWRLCAFA